MTECDIQTAYNGNRRDSTKVGMTLEDYGSSKNHRVLDMYARFCEGKVLNKKIEAERYGVNERSIQRDIDDIRAYLENRKAEGGTEQRSITYSRARKGYMMEKNETALMTNSEILAVSKILLESRAFTRAEIFPLLDKLIAGCVPLKNMKLVTDLIANERFHYVELLHKKPLNDKLWDLGIAVKECRLVEIVYRKAGQQNLVNRIVEPVAILFSEYYFYLVAYIIDENLGVQKPTQVYNYPAIYRVDRLQDFHILPEKFNIPYSERFEDGEFRKRVQFMYGGELMKIQLRYTGHAVENLLDRLPMAEIKQQDDNGWIINVEVFGEGIMMWLLGLGEQVEVLKPESLRQRMKEKIEKMGYLYKLE